VKPIAIIRPVSRRIVECELTHLAREPIDYARAVAQHAGYEAALIRRGCEIVRVPAAHEMPDAVFVEDVAVVLDEVAVMTRPGAASRRDEGRVVEAALARYRNIVRISEPGTLDGGDVLHVGKTLFVGRSERSNADGIEQLRALVSDFGYDVKAAALHDCLHLKSAATTVGEHVLLGNSAWVDRRELGDVDWIEVDAREPFAVASVEQAHVMADLRTHHVEEVMRLSFVRLDSHAIAERSLDEQPYLAARFMKLHA